MKRWDIEYDGPIQNYKHNYKIALRQWGKWVKFTDHEAEVKRFQDRIKEMEKEVVDLMLELQHKNTIIEDLYDKSKDRRPF